MNKLLFEEAIKTLKISHNKELEQTTFILSYGTSSSRCSVKEFYGKTLNKTLDKLNNFYRNLAQNIEYIRIDIINYEEQISYDKFEKKIKKIPRNNYIDFGFRLNTFKKRCFLKEEIVANAFFIPSKNHKLGVNSPNLTLDFPNYKKYVKIKYNKDDYSLNYLSKSEIIIFRTEAVFIENDELFLLKDYQNGNHFRQIDEENFPENLELVINKGSQYLLNQLNEDGEFIYGFYPCYDKVIPNYNAIRHFSSLYALLESGELLKNEEMITKAYKGLVWGFDNLSEIVDGYLLIKDYVGIDVEYKLGAQATAILACAKYAQITNDKVFFEKMKKLSQTIEHYFITENDGTIHVLNRSLEIKNKFRIIYYDGEALFSMLRAYELMKDQEIFSLCQKLMRYFVKNNYSKYHDHWLSYAVNEFLKYEESEKYFKFGWENALNNIDFMENRDTAYPTMLELLVAASKTVMKYEDYNAIHNSISNTIFNKGKARIFEVTEYRAYYEMVTGTMFPEFAMYFKAPYKIQYGFFARHDRFRMRIDDAEHFLSGLINYKNTFEKEK